MSHHKAPPQAFTGSNLVIKQDASDAVTAAKNLEAAQIKQGYKYVQCKPPYGKPYLKLVRV